MTDLMREYCRLLTRDTAACAALFAPDATLTTYFGSIPGTISGQAAILELLGKVPADLTFEVVADEESTPGRKAHVAISDRAGQLALQLVHYTSEAGRFTRFTVIPDGNPDTDLDELAGLH